MEIKSQKYKPNKEESLKAFKDMLLLRRFEEKCGQLYGMGEIGGFCHLYIGQEAVISAVDMIKQKEDSTITSYRDHAHIILAGTEPKYVLAELMGRATGCSKGKGGSMHLFDVPNKFYGGHGIVGAQVPIGTGLAFAEKYNGTNNICFTFLGDGAVNQGQVYEAFNMAALWVLPIVYIIENNEYSMGTSVARSTFMRDLYKKGESFGIKGFQLNGMDFEEMYNGVKQAAEYVRENSMPLILEVKTYRYRGHSMSDPAKYRSKEEVETYKERDPITEIRKIILENNYASEADLKEIEQSVKEIIKEAVEFSENSPLPDEEELYTNIYTR
ncbi:pyruvate dehydrogenase (acetyl-transferring) E1 component subunit alpha [Rickettsia endosymbiont of Pantilius tunicatus]|uniref:pyruvate dehydrogenase (acetyl-transferring) E1 component subunit alpha n=1 Tax=Rickettsia endosymbiont of Pantilius tunicatus TaxID=3066267 RepID=UPI00376F2067